MCPYGAEIGQKTHKIINQNFVKYTIAGDKKTALEHPRTNSRRSV